MKKSGLALMLLILTIISCQKEDNCDTNANLNGDCFNLDVTFEVQRTGGQSGYDRERFQFIYQFPPSGPQERVRFVINADDTPNGSGGPGELISYEVGTTYSGENGSFTFNGNLSAGGIPASYSYTFTKLDRENKLISGEIEFSYSNDFGSDSFTSTFTNVEVNGAEF
ncbi:MAG: hypothetical protein JJ971_03920 [Balneolaceae bacterium]|nr:hypothetical protein [Balneolaceae bacterium]MBO6545520.1 hypothetical protein [Balneolaceae bacterium]MBO6646916.1 hypothetical protein [Balneolaceae bacterium]